MLLTSFGRRRSLFFLPFSAGLDTHLAQGVCVIGLIYIVSLFLSIQVFGGMTVLVPQLVIPTKDEIY
jgi:hypothetical protein